MKLNFHCVHPASLPFYATHLRRGMRLVAYRQIIGFIYSRHWFWISWMKFIFGVSNGHFFYSEMWMKIEQSKLILSYSCSRCYFQHWKWSIVFRFESGMRWKNRSIENRRNWANASSSHAKLLTKTFLQSHI